jgi:hypothetical protein
VNTRAFHEVEPIIHRLGVALATLCLLHACTNVTGGAVELSWHLQAFDSPNLDCTFRNDAGVERAIDSIRVWWQSDTDRASIDFPCTKFHGVTSFDIPPPSALLWVEPTCPGGTPVNASAFIAPAPIERTIAVGDVVELHAVVIEIDRNNACK